MSPNPNRTSKKLRELRATHADLVAEARALIDKADAEKRDLSAEEAAQFDAIQAKIDGLNATIDREIKLVEMEASIDPRKAGHVAQHVNLDDDPKLGFKSFGEFGVLVHAKSMNPGLNDDRLRYEAAAPSTFSNESSGVDGGFLVPPEFAKEIWRYDLGEDLLAPLTQSIEIQGNSMVFPKTEQTPWGSTGLRAYWQAEATAATATKPVLGTSTLRLHKLMALTPITEELLADTSALSSFLLPLVSDSLKWKTNEAILFGTGAGQPLGAFTGAGAGTDASVLTVAKDSGQTTKTLTTLNIANMIARLPPGSFKRALWLINNDVLPALFTMTLGNYPIYLPIGQGQGGIVSSPFVGTLMGRPVLISQHANTFSSLGDVLLCDLSYYRTIVKASGVETATSMHLYFDAAATAFRVMFRIDGQPIPATAITPAKGTNKLSPFLQLEAR